MFVKDAIGLADICFLRMAPLANVLFPNTPGGSSSVTCSNVVNGKNVSILVDQLRENGLNPNGVCSSSFVLKFII